MLAFSVASRLSNSSDIRLADILRAVPTVRGSPVARIRFKVLIYLKRFDAGACGALASMNKSLAQIDKFVDGVGATKECSARK